MSVAVLISVPFAGIRVQILYYGAAQPHIDDLHALADAQYGHVPLQGQVQGLELQNIQPGVNIAGTVVLFPEEGGCDVPAAGKKQSIAGGQVFRIPCDFRYGSKSRNPSDIIDRFGRFSKNCKSHMVFAFRVKLSLHIYADFRKVKRN